MRSCYQSFRVGARLNINKWILRKFREDDDPELGTIDGQCLSTFSKAEICEIAREKGVDIEEILFISGIEDTRENICKIVHYGLKVIEEKRKSISNAGAGASTSSASASSPKASASGASVQVSNSKGKGIKRKHDETTVRHLADLF